MAAIAPEMVVFAVRALIRIGAAARESLEQRVRDSDVIMPLPEKADLKPITHIRSIADDDEFKERFLTGDLAEYWDKEKETPKDNEIARRKIIEAVELIREDKLATPDETTMTGGALKIEETGYLILKQWADGKEPPPPLARVVLSMAEVALEFVGTNPSILGIGSSGGKFVSALSWNLRELLPDADDPKDWKARDWSKFYFVRRAIAIFLHAGLKTIAEKPDLLIEESQYRELTTNVLTPLVKKFEEEPEKVPSLIIFRDTLLGPVASAAFKTLAEHQEAFLGGKFSDSKAVGALSKTLFGTIAEAGKTDIRDVFTDDGLVQVYQALLGVMVNRPELFVGRGEEAEDKLKQDLLRNFAAVLKKSPPPFNDELAAPLTIAALDSLGKYAANSLDKDDAWEAVAEKSIVAFVEGLKHGLKNGSLEETIVKVLSREQIVVFAEIFFNQAAKTPGMLLPKSAEKELENLVGAVAHTMALDAAKLLSGDDWLAIAQVAAAEAAKNPNRLFNIDASDPEGQLAAQLIKQLLLGAADSFGEEARKDGKIMFGETLRQVIITSFKAAAGNIGGAAEHLGELQALEKRVNKLAADNKQRIGAREAILLFEQLITTVIDDGRVVVERDDQMVSIAISEIMDEELMRLLTIKESNS